MTRARDRIRRVEAKRPREPVVVAFATSGKDRSADLMAWWRRMLDKYGPAAQG